MSKWAFDRKFRSPNQEITVESIAREIICEYIDNVERMEAGLRVSDEITELAPEPPDHDPDNFIKFEGPLSTPENRQE